MTEWGAYAALGMTEWGKGSLYRLGMTKRGALGMTAFRTEARGICEGRRAGWAPMLGLKT